MPGVTSEVVLICLIVVSSLMIVVSSPVVVSIASSVDNIGLPAVVGISSMTSTVKCDQSFLNQTYFVPQ